jgi:hypothetical protein
VEGRGIIPLLYRDPPRPVDPTPWLLLDAAAAAAAAAAMASNVEDPLLCSCLAPSDPAMGSGALPTTGTCWGAVELGWLVSMRCPASSKEAPLVGGCELPCDCCALLPLSDPLLRTGLCIPGGVSNPIHALSQLVSTDSS